ncbi:MAG: hypothetical protein U0838_12385 [Chloroflexota bacterium]
MAAVVGYVLVATLAIIATLIVAGPRHIVRRDPTFALEDVAGRQVSILGALAGFAVTGVVFLVTQAKNVPDPGGISFTTVLTMFVVAYMGYFSTSVLFANVSPRLETGAFDLPAAQYAGASISLFAVFLGWFALKPLFETFGLTQVATLTGWFLVGAVAVGYGVLGGALFRSGYASARQIALLAAFAVIGSLVYAVVAALVPGLRAAEATLALTVTAFLAGVPAYLAMTLLPIAAHRAGLAPILASRWHLAVLAYAQAVLVLTGFLLLAVLGLA